LLASRFKECDQVHDLLAQLGDHLDELGRLEGVRDVLAVVHEREALGDRERLVIRGVARGDLVAGVVAAAQGGEGLGLRHAAEAVGGDVGLAHEVEVAVSRISVVVDSAVRPRPLLVPELCVLPVTLPSV
jgi:hypothetical protein